MHDRERLMEAMRAFARAQEQLDEAQVAEAQARVVYVEARRRLRLVRDEVVDTLTPARARVMSMGRGNPETAWWPSDGCLEAVSEHTTCCSTGLCGHPRGAATDKVFP